MAANSWILKASPDIGAKVQRWLDVEATQSYTMDAREDAVLIDFHGIQDAFKFRLQFDEQLVG
jgi:hypothetical protein